MFFAVLMILATIWRATNGALSCKTTQGLDCVFPFKRSTGGSEYNECQKASKGRTWCATALKSSGAYSAWGYCDMSTCKDVQTVAEATKQIQLYGSCYGCIEQAAHGPPPHWQSLDCLRPCVLSRDNQACFQCLVETATRQCLVPCGFPRVLETIAFPADGSETCTVITPFSAIQSSTFPNATNSFSPNSDAANAIDGNAATTATTKGDDTFPWIAVQLKEDSSKFTVKRVIITNRVDSEGQLLKNMDVYLSDHQPASSDSSFGDDEGVTKIGNFRGPGQTAEIIDILSSVPGAMGSVVVLQMQNVKDKFSIGEIIIFSN